MENLSMINIGSVGPWVNLCYGGEKQVGQCCPRVICATFRGKSHLNRLIRHDDSVSLGAPGEKSWPSDGMAST